MQELVEAKDYYITKNDHAPLGKMEHATLLVKTTSWFGLKTKIEKQSIFRDMVFWRYKDTLKFVPDTLNHDINTFIRLLNLKPLN